jgi:glucose-6-phosphate-specific signal transduction histidine kinase
MVIFWPRIAAIFQLGWQGALLSVIIAELETGHISISVSLAGRNFTCANDQAHSAQTWAGRPSWWS